MNPGECKACQKVQDAMRKGPEHSRIIRPRDLVRPGLNIDDARQGMRAFMNCTEYPRCLTAVV